MRVILEYDVVAMYWEGKNCNILELPMLGES